ncbi:SBBP repeat-containing protein [Candidatus Woesearchaeota archaeon]|nr:SBBP repeat-containing protein [Candidatus Woesearchaeota archaeon]
MTYDSGNDEEAYGIAVDSSGNVYVTGYSEGVTSDMLTFKYDSSGNELWNITYDSGNDEWASGVTVDSSDNVYVTGESYNGADNDVLTLKYDSSGNEIWNVTYDSGNDDSGAYGIAVDSSDNVYVTGYSDNGANWDYLTLKYDTDGKRDFGM